MVPSGGSAKERVVVVAKLQSAVQEIERQRGTLAETLEQKILILAEEAFEVLKTLRVRAGVATDFYWSKGALGDELLDVLFVTCAIANRLTLSLADNIEALVADGRLTLPECAPEAKDPLDAGLAVTRGVLAVVVASGRTVEHLPTNNIETNSTFVPDVQLALGQLVMTVLALCDAERVEIARLVGHALEYDQLRLWVNVEPR